MPKRSDFSSIILAIAGWTLPGLLYAAPAYGTGELWLQVLKNSLAQWWAWGIVSLFIVAIDRRLPFSERNIGSRLLSHVAVCIVLTNVHAYLFAGFRAVAGTGSFAEVASLRILIDGFKGGMLWSLLVYWLILGAWLTKQYYSRFLTSELRMERLERLNSEARLHALRLQLDPHFLFNALNTISSQVEADPKLARAMIEHLGDLLRLSLEINQQQHVPLVDELTFLEHYLSIQRIRFGDRLRFEQCVDDDAKLAMVPSMTIQPLVENAIRHGVSPRASGGTVCVEATCRADSLWIRVRDDGVGLPDDWLKRPTEGLGLSVTRQRLDGFYPGGKSSFSIRPRAHGGVEVELRIPLSYAIAISHG